MTDGGDGDNMCLKEGGESAPCRRPWQHMKRTKVMFVSHDTGAENSGRVLSRSLWFTHGPVSWYLAARRPAQAAPRTQASRKPDTHTGVKDQIPRAEVLWPTMTSHSWE